MEKTCTRCKITLEADTNNFVVDSKGKLGLSSRCKSCLAALREGKKEAKKEYDQNYRGVNVEKRRSYSRDYFQSHKEEKRYYDKKYRESNKQKIKKRKRDYYLRNKDAVNKKSIYQTQKRRARKKSLPVGFKPKDWEAAKLFFDNKCAYCRKDKELAQEHFVALSKGGGYVVSNILPSCRDCNLRKGTKEFSEWYKTTKNYSPEQESKILSYLGKESAS